MVTPADIKERFPAFGELEDGDIQKIIDRAGPYFDVARWDDLLDEGMGLWVAHQLALQARDATAGSNNGGFTDATTMKKVDQMQKSMSAEIIKAGMDNPYMATVYGQQYLDLRRLVGIGATAV